VRPGTRPGLPNRSTPLIVWVVGIVVAALVVWLVFRLLDPQELQEIGPVGAAFASVSRVGQLPITHSSNRGDVASHEEPIA
jgi:hypothetical protein